MVIQSQYDFLCAITWYTIMVVLMDLKLSPSTTCMEYWGVECMIELKINVTFNNIPSKYQLGTPIMSHE